MTPAGREFCSLVPDHWCLRSCSEYGNRVRAAGQGYIAVRVLTPSRRVPDANSTETSAILIEGFGHFPVSLQESSVIIPPLSHDRFLCSPIHQSSYLSVLYTAIPRRNFKSRIFRLKHFFLKSEK